MNGNKKKIIYTLILFLLPFLMYKMFSEYMDMYRINRIDEMKSTSNYMNGEYDNDETKNEKRSNLRGINEGIDISIIFGNIGNLEKIESMNDGKYNLIFRNLRSEKIIDIFRELEIVCKKNNIFIKYERILFKSDGELEILCKF